MSEGDKTIDNSKVENPLSLYYLEQLKNITFKDIIAFIAFIGATSSIFYLYGLSCAIDFPIMQFISIQDYLNFSIYLLIPNIGVIILIFAIAPYILAFSYRNNRNKNQYYLKYKDYITKEKILISYIKIGIGLVGNLIILIGFAFVLNLFPSQKTTPMPFYNYLIFPAIIIFIFLFYFLTFICINKIYLYRRINQLKDIIPFNFILFLSSLLIFIVIDIFMGFSYGARTAILSYQGNKYCIVDTKDNSQKSGTLILNLDKCVIIKMDSIGIVAIRYDNIKSINFKSKK